MNPTDPLLSDIEKGKAISLYADELNSTNHNLQNQSFTIPTPEKDKTIDESVHKLLDDVSHRIKRGKKQGNNSSGEDSDDFDESPCKKSKAKESEMGWFDPDESSSDPNDTFYQETYRCLQIYNKDISRSKFLVRNSKCAPEGIPSSQWEWILGGETLDLDHFLWSLHHTTITEEGETHTGNTKISTGIIDAKKMCYHCHQMVFCLAPCHKGN